MHSLIFGRKLTVNGVEKGRDVSVSAEALAELSAAIPASAENRYFLFELNAGLCRSFYMVANRDLVINTNSAGDPDNVFNLEKNVPFTWTHKDGTSARDTEGTALSNIAAFYVSNPDGTGAGAAALDVVAAYDPLD